MPSCGELDQLVRLFCPECTDERPFERPECLDGHGPDCPELACVECGTAILVAPLTQPDAGEPRPTPGRAGPRVVRTAGTGATRPAGSQPEPRRLAGVTRAPRSLA
jgi:hypothetical protein